MSASSSMFQIPPDGLSAIKLLLDLPGEGVHGLTEGLRAIGPTLVSTQTKSLMLQEFIDEGSSTGEVYRILDDFITPIVNIREGMELAGPRLYALLGDAADSSGDQEWEAKYQDKWNTSQEAIETLLDLRELRIEIKARELLEQRPNWVSDVRVFTDTRPVFDDEAQEINANVLCNTLRIRFGDGKNMRTEYFALDPSDLDNLETQIERAKRKNDAITEQNEQLGIPTLSISSEDYEDEIEEENL